MKKLLLTFAMLGAFFSLTSEMCSTEEQIKDFNCKCVYVASDTTQANKEEFTVVKAEDNFDADMECNNLECKYCTQYFSGTCTIQ
jgi:hypothetical protein